MANMLEDAWARIHTWLTTHAPTVLESLCPRATDEQLRDAESAMGVVLPPEVRACYRVHNGQKAIQTRDSPLPETVPGFLYGEEWLSLEQMVQHWQIKHKLLSEGAFFQAGSPRGPILPVWWHPAWIPLTTDSFGYMKCLDLAPATGGQVGQVIYWEKDEPSRGVVSPSLTDWFSDFAEALEKGEYTTAPEIRATSGQH